MKRSLSFPLLIGLMVVLALAFSACGAPAAQETGEPAAEEAAPAEEAEAPAAEATEAPVEEAPPTRPPRVRSSRSARLPRYPHPAPGRWRSHGRRHGIAEEEINANGGLLGRPVELIVEDTEGLPERGTAVMEKAHQPGPLSRWVVDITVRWVWRPRKGPRKRHPGVFAETWNDTITSSMYPEIFRIAPAQLRSNRG
ncbi:MAG: hypothetical protein R2838_06970 [Caldilineaceae bacterium]